ncbi:MAG: NRPS [Candelaria pacifica]|nr:MAG: NRPS [Candelaria pacifica]
MLRSLLSQSDADLILRTLDATLQLCLDYSSGLISDYSSVNTDILSLVNEKPDIRSLPPQRLLHSGFEENVQLRPEAPALDFLHSDGERTIWSFECLNQVSNQIAHVLMNHNVQHDQAIPICMSKSPHFYASVLAVLKAGATYTPIDPQAPTDRKQYMLNELQAKLLLTCQAVDVSWTRVWTFNVDDPYAMENMPKSDLCINQPCDANLAYRLYTSGSTGRPKAVSVEHRHAAQTIVESKSILPWTTSTRLLQYAATTFDMCYYDCFLAWTYGIPLCAAPQATLLDDLTIVINTLGITMLDLTPTVASTLAKESVPNVDCLYCIGEPMPQQLADTWAGKCLNSYGPTEIKSSIIGAPFPSTSFSVRAESGESIMPRLGMGELYIGGAQIARGYHANPELTQASFIRTKDGQRWYRSGDMVRMLSNGQFEYLGRKDDQVKIRGLRVELAEVNSVIKDGHPFISDVSTQVLKYSSKSQDQLVVFLGVPNLDGSRRGSEVKEAARSIAEKRLAKYMIPQIYIALQSLPRSTAGKVDKMALLQVFRRIQAEKLGQHKEVAAERAWSKDETKIRGIFSNLSGIDEGSIGHDMTIYELGLDSISAGQIAAQLRTVGIDTSTGDVLEHPTISQLATLLGKENWQHVPKRPEFDFTAFDKKHRAAICNSLGIRSRDLQTIRPCTPVQAGMIAQFLHSRGTAYFNSLTLRLAQDVDISTLKDAWIAVAAKYQMLRTGFANVNDTDFSFAMLTYHSKTTRLPWSERHSSFIKPSSTVKKEIGLNKSSHQMLRLPPWRLLLEENHGTRDLHFSALHALYDAQVLQMILADVASVYYGHSINTEMPLESTISTILYGNVSDNSTDDFWRAYGRDTYIKRFPNMTPLREESKITKSLSRTCSFTRSHIEDICRQRGVTVQVAGQAAWGRVLSAYTGELCVTFGLVLSGRNMSASAERAAFPCLTTLPVSFKVQGSNGDLLQQIMSITTAVMKHQFTPLTRIQRTMGYPNEPLFDSIFAYQKLMPSDDEPYPWEEVHEEATVDYAVSVELVPAKCDRLQFRITFTEGFLPQAQADLLLRQLDTALLNSVSDPEATCTDMSTFNRELLSITPPKEPSLPSEVQLLHQFVEVNARQYPDRIALEFALSLHDTKVVKEQWSYRELNAEGDKVAHLLMHRGVRTGDLIAICFDKCPQASFAILGILKAGCAYVALDPAAPVARRCFILEDSQAKLVIGMKEQAVALQEHTEVSILSLDILSETKTLPSGPPALSDVVRPSNTCYCLYTSGTTGTPKGCEITHENAVQAMLSFQRLFKGHWDDRSRWLQFASFHFDVSVLEQYWSWSVGICVTSAPRDLIFQDIAGTIQQLRITHIDLTPSLASTLHPDDVPSLCQGVFITGGEQLKQEILDVWGPKGVIYNGYGPTEATIGCTMFPRVPHNGKPSNIGPQFDNVGTYVLRPNSSIPVLRGAVGELCISGSLVCRGYLYRPQLTEAKFPVLSQFNERVYRTGDLVRILHDNTFEFLGRTDDQVKLRGQRLEIGEINVVVRSASDDIQDCVTLVLKHPKHMKEQLVSFLVSKTCATPSHLSRVEPSPESQELVASVRDECRAKLPGYMVPTHFVLLSSIPLSGNNKADSKQLTAIYEHMTVEELRGLDAGLGPGLNNDWSNEERRIADVLSNRLGLPCELDQRRSSFFELGLDSITVISFANSLREAGFPGAQTSVVMSYPTIDTLAKALQNSEGQEMIMRKSLHTTQQRIAAFAHKHTCSILEDLKISLDAVESIVPCTPLQEGILSRSTGSDTSTYFGAFLFELEPSVVLARLKSAWARVIARSQILRTRFVLTPDGYAQVAMRDSEFPWSEMHVSIGAEAEKTHDRYKQWSSGNHNAIERPFELVIIRSSAKSIMSVHMFHAVYDGSSLPLMMDRLRLEYLEAHAIEYGPAFHDALLYGPLRQVDGAEAFWTKHLGHSRSTRMPPLITRPLEHDSAATLVVTDVEYLERLRRNLDATHQALIQACWVAALQRYLSSSVTLGMVVSGRSIDVDKAELTIGPLFNTIPFHVALDKSESWRSLISKCQRYTTAALPYQHTPLRDIIKWCQKSSAGPLFDTLFVFQRVSTDLMTAPRRLWTPLDSKSQVDYPLAFEAEQQSDGTLKMTIVAQGNISSAESSHQLLEAVKRNLFQMLADPDASINNASDLGTHTTNGNIETALPTSKTNRKTTAPAEQYSWSTEAYSVRDEIASLANVDADLIQEHTSIFELGLDSIDAIKLFSRLKRRGIDISVSKIMKLPTVAGMTDHLSTKPTSIRESSILTDLADFRKSVQGYLQQRQGYMKGVEDILPVTPLQEAMVAEMIQSDYTRYFNHDVLKVMPWVNVHRLENAWRTVVEHSPVLRTSFAEIDDPEVLSTYAQIIHSQSNIIWTDVSIEGLEDIQKIFGRIRQEAATNAMCNPPFKLTLARSRKETYLIVSIAHALYDGWSLSLLHEDLRRAYQECYLARPSYRDMIADIVSTSGLAAATYWKHALSGAKSQLFPKRGVSKHPLLQVVNRMERISSAPVKEMQSFCRAQGITMQTLGQTCWACMLAYSLKALDVVFGSVLSGRNTEEANDILFPAMNTVAIRSVLHGTRKDMLRYMQELSADLLPHQHYPLRKIQAMTESPDQKLFDSLFIYQKRPEQQPSEENQLYESIDGSSEVDYPVCVEMEQVNNSLIWRTACHNSIVSSEDTAEMLENLDSILLNVVRFPDADVLNFQNRGISICDLPVFESKSEDALKGQSHEKHVRKGSHSSNEWSPTESTIRSVLSYVSKTPEVEVDPEMTIFRLGLDSISAIKVSSLLRKRSIKLTVSDMLQAATIRKMARIVDGQSMNEAPPAVDTKAVLAKALKRIDAAAVVRSSGFDVAKLEEVLPASAGQTYMLSVWQNSQGTLFYPVFNHSLQGSLDKASLEEAWCALVGELPILRTTFVATGNDTAPLLQVVFGHVSNPVVWLPIDDTEVLLRSKRTDFKSPPVALYAQRTTTGFRLRLQIHHALYDGVSLSEIIRRLEELCNHGGSQTVISPSFADFLALEDSQSGEGPRKKFWKGYLPRKSTLLPLATATGSVRRAEVFRPKTLGNVYKLERFARRQGLSVQMLFLAIFSKVHARIIKIGEGTNLVQDTIFGIYLANRSHHLEGLSTLAAPTVNLVPLRVKAQLHLPIVEIAQKIQQDLQVIGRIENSGVALWEIERWTGIRIDCFVNFLKLPDHEGDQYSAKGLTDKVTILEAKNGSDDGFQRLSIPEKNGYVEPGLLAKNMVKDAYLASLDVEATIRDGFLDIGVFCPENILEPREADNLITEISKALEAVWVSDDEAD